MYVSTTGHFPFDESNHERMIANQLAHRVKFPSKWTGSKQLKQIILSSLEPVPTKRPNYMQLMEMEFLKGTPHTMKSAESRSEHRG